MTLPEDQTDARSPSDSGQPAALFRRQADLAPGLYVVSTPIGNLRDISLRALDILASVETVFAEDTRVAIKLMSAYGVSTPLRPYHDHNGAEVRPAILERLKSGARLALVSDAGTPLVSDPGYKLVREALEAGIAVYAAPGASAPLAALAVAGLPTDRFMFAGFPPQKGGARRTFLASLSETDATLVMFEGPSRLAASLADMATTFGPREAAVARELTKTFEEVRRGSLSELAAHYEQAGPPRGEVVVLVGPPQAVEADAVQLDRLIAAADAARPVSEVAAEIAKAMGLPRRDVYRRLVEARQTGDQADD